MKRRVLVQTGRRCRWSWPLAPACRRWRWPPTRRRTRMIKRLSDEVLAAIKADKAIQAGDTEQDHGAGRQQDHAQRELPAHDGRGRGPGLAPGHARAEKAAAGRVQDPAGAHLLGRAWRRSTTRPSASSRSAARRRTPTWWCAPKSAAGASRSSWITGWKRRPGQGAGWRIYNLNVLGVWLVETYRNQFAPGDQRQGPRRPDRDPGRAQQVQREEGLPRRAEAQHAGPAGPTHP